MEIHNPDDQVASLRRWWAQYGKSLLAGVVLGIIILSALTYWRQYRTTQGQEASVLYDSLLSSQQMGQRDTALATANKLMQEFSATPYAGKAALVAARLYFDQNNPAEVRKVLEWAAANAKENAVQHSARLRLGRVLLEQKEIDAVLKLIDVRDRTGFESEYEELRGDALLAKGDGRAAREAYALAFDKLPDGSGYGKWLAMKRDSLSSDKLP